MEGQFLLWVLGFRELNTKVVRPSRAAKWGARYLQNLPAVDLRDHTRLTN